MVATTINHWATQRSLSTRAMVIRLAGAALLLLPSALGIVTDSVTAVIAWAAALLATLLAEHALASGEEIDELELIDVSGD